VKILFVLPEYGDFPGGISTFYRHLLPALASRGHAVEALVTGQLHKAPPNGTVDGVVIRRLEDGAAECFLDRFNIYSAVPEVRGLLATAWAAWEQANQGDGFDVVETTDYGMLFVPWAVHQDRPPFVVQLHSSNGQLGLHDPIEKYELATRARTCRQVCSWHFGE
jgi:hypothetical protein